MARKPRWDKHSIKAEIHRRGHTLNSLGAQYKLNDGDVSKALDQRFPKAERVIMEFLEVPAHQLWPDRYDSDGYAIRYIRKPQPNKPLTRAATNRINQAKTRRAAMQGAA